MIEGVLQVADMQVRDIMIPRGQMVVIDHEDSFSEIIEKITESGHSRFPVIDDDKDDVVGILLAKDLLSMSCWPRICCRCRSTRARVSRSTNLSDRPPLSPKASV
jgi:Mg2+/Co2+ transporter CorC